MHKLGDELRRAIREGKATPAVFHAVQPDDEEWTVERIALAIRSEIGRRKTLVYVQHERTARELKTALNQIGVIADELTWNVPLTKGIPIVDDFRTGATQILIGSKILVTIGLNVPDVACVVLMRKTKSDTEFVQMIEKGLRMAPGKADCLIVDFTAVV